MDEIVNKDSPSKKLKFLKIVEMFVFNKDNYFRLKNHSTS
jgi:hypothetical protein